MTESNVEDRADWPFLRHGATTLFWRKHLFESAKADLLSLDYNVVAIKCATIDQFTADFGDALGWEKQFGYSPWTGNLDALNDGLRHMEFPPSLAVAFAFESYHLIAAQDALFANAVLDVIEHQARDHLVAGERMVALVRTDDASFTAHNLGTRGATWNAAEWMDANRR